MKVLLLFPRFGIGGIAKSMSFVANICAKAFMDVTCVSMSNEEVLIELPEKAKKVYINYKETGKRFELIINKIYFLLAFRQLIRKERPDVIVSFGTDYVRIVTFATIGLKINIIGSERGNPFIYTKRQKKKYIYAMKKCYAVVFQTEQAKNFYPLEIKEKSIILPNPCVIKEHLQKKVNCKSRNVILVFSRLSEEKNIAGIVRAFAKAQRQLTDFELHIYGKGPEKANIKTLISEKNIKNIYLFDDESGCRMFVLNSITEGFPNALIEAMLEGIPCIASDCPSGGVRFLSDDGRRVHLIPVNDEDALAQAMVKVATDNEYANSLVEKAREIEFVLNPDKIGKEWIKLIKGAANGKAFKKKAD